MTNNFTPSNPQNSPPLVLINEYSSDPAAGPTRAPVARQIIGVGTTPVVSAPFNPATNFIQMSPQYLIGDVSNVLVFYAIGLPPFVNASITTPLTAVAAVPVGQGQSAAFLASVVQVTASAWL